MSIAPGSLEHAVHFLETRGVVLRSLLNIGSAAGHLGWMLKQKGLMRAAGGLNIDAQTFYEPWLGKIRRLTGIDYRICAVGEENGTLDIAMSSHPYWASARPDGDVYWERLGNVGTGERVGVPCYRIDTLVEMHALSGPFVLHLDIQGSELAALKGASKTLADTDVISIESDVDDFDGLHRAIVESGFDLFNLSLVNYLADGGLGWFYPIYMNRRHAQLRSRNVWPAEYHEQAKAQQRQRHEQISAAIDRAHADLDRPANPYGQPIWSVSTNVKS